MDKIKFAQLVNWLSRLGMAELSSHEMQVLLNQVTAVPVVGSAACEQVDELLRCMKAGTSKIEAIKAYRVLTGADLKESKDAVEKYWLTNS